MLVKLAGSSKTASSEPPAVRTYCKFLQSEKEEPLFASLAPKRVRVSGKITPVMALPIKADESITDTFVWEKSNTPVKFDC